VETWPRGRRHFPAKEAYGLKPVSRVRIPPSPPETIKNPLRNQRVFYCFFIYERFIGISFLKAPFAKIINKPYKSWVAEQGVDTF
jgi:hypothetical protein